MREDEHSITDRARERQAAGLNRSAAIGPIRWSDQSAPRPEPTSPKKRRILSRRKSKVDLTENIELRLLRHELKRIGEALDELPIVAQSTHHTERERAIIAARRDLKSLRAITEAKIADLTRPVDIDKIKQDEARLDAMEAAEDWKIKQGLSQAEEQNAWDQWTRRFVNQVFTRRLAAHFLGAKQPPGY